MNYFICYAVDYLCITCSEKQNISKRNNQILFVFLFIIQVVNQKRKLSQKYSPQ